MQNEIWLNLRFCFTKLLSAQSLLSFAQAFLHNRTDYVVCVFDESEKRVAGGNGQIIRKKKSTQRVLQEHSIFFATLHFVSDKQVIINR